MMKNISLDLPDTWVNTLESVARREYRSLEGQILSVLSANYDLPAFDAATGTRSTRDSTPSEAEDESPVQPTNTVTKRRVPHGASTEFVLREWVARNPDLRALSVQEFTALIPPREVQDALGIDIDKFAARFSGIAFRQSKRDKGFFRVKRKEAYTYAKTTRYRYFYELTSAGFDRAMGI